VSLFNVSFLSSYYSSSSSSWEKFKVGQPTDGSTNNERFSIHTEKEVNPFVCFSFLKPIRIKKIELVCRTKYLQNSLPITIESLLDGNWVKVLNVNSVTDPTAVSFADSQQFSALRVVSRGFTTLDFSSLNIFAESSEFLKDWQFSELPQSGMVYAHTAFYGLGGKLSVVASALGYAGNETQQKSVFVDSSLSRVLAFPTPFIKNAEHSSNAQKFLNLYAPIAIRDFIFEGKYVHERNIALHVPAQSRDNICNRFSFISRDSIEPYKINDENGHITKQRLYKRLIPSNEVLKLKNELAEKYKFNGQNSLGVHIRHGNGELYKKELDKHNRWGVKPPNFAEICAAANKFIEKNTNIDTIVICSDSFVTEDIVKKSLKRKIKTLFISDSIQDVGCGCNHNNSVFDSSVKRRTIDRDQEDVIALSEMLLISQCHYLIGGSSFFFDAVIGFSLVKPENIIQINNKDRYIDLPKSFVLVTSELAMNIKEALVEEKIPLDALFINQADDSIGLYYFEKLILELKNLKGLGWLQKREIRKFLLDARGY
jgi:hypothetical protein